MWSCVRKALSWWEMLAWEAHRSGLKTQKSQKSLINDRTGTCCDFSVVTHSWTRQSLTPEWAGVYIQRSVLKPTRGKGVVLDKGEAPSHAAAVGLTQQRMQGLTVLLERAAAACSLIRNCFKKWWHRMRRDKKWCLWVPGVWDLGCYWGLFLSSGLF